MFAITGDVADTASADICMFRHLADISSVVPAARTLITLGTRYHCLNCRITSIVLNIFIINTPRLLRNHELGSNEDKSDLFTQQFQLLDRTVSIVSIFQRHFCFGVRFDAIGFLIFQLFVDLVLDIADIVPECVIKFFILFQAKQPVVPFAGEDIFSRSPGR